MLSSLGALGTALTLRPALAQLSTESDRFYACGPGGDGLSEPVYTQDHLDCLDAELQRQGIPLTFESVAGREALAFLDEKAGDGRSHFLAGTIEDAFSLVEQIGFSNATAEQILGRASKTDGKAWLAAELLYAKRYALDRRPPDRIESIDGTEFEVRVLEPSDFANMKEVPLSDVPVGDWPAEVQPNRVPSVLWDYRTGQPAERLVVATLDREDWTETPAVLKYGDWNACPPPEVHVAVWRYWQRVWGIRLVSAKFNTLEFAAARRPETRAAALSLAREQYAYCSDIVDQGTGDLATLAAILMESPYWFFWWD